MARAALFGVLGLLAACSEIPVDSPPDLDTKVQGTIEGSITYVGPRPFCEFDEYGAPYEIPGVVVMMLIDDANPPPPEGTNQGVASILAVPGTELFTFADCRPRDPAAFDPADTIMRGVDFVWPQVDLAAESGQTVSYRVTGFYDQRGDFSPFFTIQSASTKGDIAGAAVKSQTDPSFELVTLGNVVDSPLGEVHPGVAVMLGGYVRTEPPMFRVVGASAMNAALPIPFTTIPLNMQTTLLTSSSFTLRMFGRDLPAGDTDDQDLDRVLSALHLNGDPNEPLRIDPELEDPVAYAWYHKQLDLDGVPGPDPHPVLGPISQSGLPADDLFRLETPVVMLQRIRSPEEVLAGIPDVGLQAASPNRDHGSYPDLPGVEYPDTQVIVPPIASVLLNLSASPLCQVPYMPPGSPKEFYEANPANPLPVECAEIPTGAYGVNVMQGIVGGTLVSDIDSQTGFDVDGGSFSGQLWAVPNALGEAAQLENLLPPDPVTGQPTPVASQSRDQTLYFVDTTAGPTGRQEDPAYCSTEAFFGAAGIPNYKTGFPDQGECAQGLPSLEDVCCEPIRHLCLVPRCPYDACDTGIISSPREGMGEYRDFTYTNTCGQEVTDRAYFPECIPFEMPYVCCDEIWNDADGQTPHPAPLTVPFQDPNTCPAP